MSAALSINVNGEREIVRALRKLDDRLVRRVMRKAVRAGANPIVRTARQNVPRSTGLLRKSLGTKVKTYNNGTIVAIIGPRTGFKQLVNGKPRNPTKYAHLVEFGTKAHLIGRAGIYFRVLREWVGGPIEHPGSTGTRFLTRAFQFNQRGSRRAMSKKALQEIEKEAQKLRAKR